ncbi:MAG: hypothetical protein SFV15_06200 [Polyangiaceae bacterium]|nr:hypothetical protein [Polyangiaceae bacterium]
MRLRPFVARDFPALVRGLERLPWQAYLGQAKNVHVSVTCHQSRLYHSDAVAERVFAVAAGGLNRPLVNVARKDAEQSVFVRILDDRVQVSVDASGALLFRRGDKQQVGRAPLRETLGAGLVRTLGEAERIWDPFCGSGTLLLEWLLARQRRAPGARRTFAFEQWPAFRSRQEQWQVRKAQASQRSADVPSEVIAWGDDTDAHDLAAARENLGQAGLSSAVKLAQLDFEKMAEKVPPRTAIISNPPYGARLESARVPELYERFDRLLLRRVDLRPAVIITGYLPYRTHSRLPWRAELRTKVGGISAEVLRLA